ncbi:putative GPI-anchored protein pfl2 [Xenopus laevis]|uniref:GPI-anchored protein pfl2 n=1 Tax=Xenopus laevis TaxID=8355 RepID=A0A8J1LZZ9_XENLA|nr:putative GPI-anchored protein pfl2 [Xenopus laevis]
MWTTPSGALWINPDPFRRNVDRLTPSGTEKLTSWRTNLLVGPRNLLLLQLLLTLPVALYRAETTISQSTITVTAQFNSSTPNLNATTSAVSKAINSTEAVSVSVQNSTKSPESNTSNAYSTTSSPTKGTYNATESTKSSTIFIQNNTSTYSTVKPENSTFNSTTESTIYHTDNTSHVFPTYSTLRPENSTSNSTESQIWRDFTENPGLVAVICIFVAILCISLVVFIVKSCQNNGPQFKRLDEVPMDGINEESPFAHYPPK